MTTIRLDIKVFDCERNAVYEHLEQRNFVKYLGVLIDSNLSWKDHIDYVALKQNNWYYNTVETRSSYFYSSSYLSLSNSSLHFLRSFGMRPNFEIKSGENLNPPKKSFMFNLFSQ